jgi:hypothetical protein
MRFLYASVLSFFISSLASAEEVLHQTTDWIESDKVVLRGLDKISARVFTSEVYVNQKIHFGSLEIYVRNASRSPPEDQPESACFLEIYDNKQGQQRQKVFSGWMFSSNPALSALEHPVYDIWVKDVVVPAASTEATPGVVVTETAAVDKTPEKAKAAVVPKVIRGNDHHEDEELEHPGD